MGLATSLCTSHGTNVPWREAFCKRLSSAQSIKKRIYKNYQESLESHASKERSAAAAACEYRLEQKNVGSESNKQQ